MNDYQQMVIDAQSETIKALQMALSLATQNIELLKEIELLTRKNKTTAIFYAFNLKQ